MKCSLTRLNKINPSVGFRFVAAVPDNSSDGDCLEHPERSALKLFEDGIELGPAHVDHQAISDQGSGRFSHWERHVWFSASDNSDPRSNGRSYTIVYPVGAPGHHAVPSVGAATGQAVPQAAPAFIKDRISRLARFDHATGLAYTARLPAGTPKGDEADQPPRSSLRLFENGLELGPAHSLHQDIARLGGGRFSHWQNELVFSTTDGSDPSVNGRSYDIVYCGSDGPRRATLRDCMNVEVDVLNDEQRYLWAERAFNAIVPNERLADFSRIMFRDAEFLADYERFDRQNYRTFDRKFALRELLKLVLPLEGELAECGVYQGATAYMMGKAVARSAPGKRVHLFDSFSGLSDPKPDLDGAYWRAGAMAYGLEKVTSNLKDYADYFVFHPGWIPERFSEISDKRFCFVHVDVDLFEPTRDSLDFLGPRMVPGGLIVCDDYGFDTCPGARKAMDEFAAERGMPVVHLPTGQGVLFFGR